MGCRLVLSYFTYRIAGAKAKLETVCLASVQWVVVEHANVYRPLLEALGGDEVDAWR